MTDYKLVPVEPTLDMLREGMDVYASEDCAEADVLGIYKSMLAAAPTVQGEPVGYIRKSALELMKSDELGVRANIIKEPRYPDCVALYTAPQPAPGLTEALRQYQHNDGSGLVFGYDRLLVDQYVAGLVEALEFIAKSVHPQGNGPGVVIRDVDGRDWRNWLETAEQLLAAHRKQGGEA